VLIWKKHNINTYLNAHITLTSIKKTMKKILTLALVSLSISGYAQYFQPINVKKGQVISVVSTVNTDSDMGMGTMKNNMQMKSAFTIIDENDKSFILTASLKGIKMDMDGMGQQMSFDSEKPEDKSSPMAEGLGEKLSAIDTFAVNKNTGLITRISKKKDSESNGMGMVSSGNGSEPVNEIFFAVPMSKKIGDSWQDSSSTEGLTTKKTYTLVSREKNIATIKYMGVNFGNINSEVQGTPMTAVVDSKLSGELKVNMETGLLISSTGDVDNNTAMEVMGQNMNISSKVKMNTACSVQ
jgi:hypothetical protein